MPTIAELPTRSSKCAACAEGIEAPFAFTMAFQPVVDLSRRRIYAYEALVRGPGGESAASVLGQVTAQNRYAFDQSCRVKAIEWAAALNIGERGAKLSINFIPGAMYEPEACVRATLNAAKRCGLHNDQIILELTENEEIIEPKLIKQIFEVYRRHDLRIAIDDFGAGFSGLGLLARFQPDLMKIDMELVRGIDESARRRAIMRAILAMAAEIGIGVVAEGVETAAELETLQNLGVTMVQGYYFAKPGFESLPTVTF